MSMSNQTSQTEYEWFVARRAEDLATIDRLRGIVEGWVDSAKSLREQRDALAAALTRIAEMAERSDAAPDLLFGPIARDALAGVSKATPDA